MCSQTAVPTVSELPQEGLQRGSDLDLSAAKRHVDRSAHAESLAPAPVMVRFRFTTSMSPLTDHLPNVGTVSIIYWRMPETSRLT